MQEKSDITIDAFFTLLADAEERYRKIYNDAIDIDDWNQSQEVQRDASSKIRQIKKWKTDLLKIYGEITTSDLMDFSASNPSALNIEPSFELKYDPDESEHFETVEIGSNEDADLLLPGSLRVGQYVREKMRELSKRDYVFSLTECNKMCGKRWSKASLNLNYPFARILKENEEISVQTKDENGYNRYWNEVFKFDRFSLLLCSQWFIQDKEYFDAWYIRLSQQSQTESIAEISVIDSGEDILEIENLIINPISMSVLGKKYPIRFWNEMLVKVCEIMLLKKPYIVATFDKNEKLNSDRRTNFSYSENEIKFTRKRLSNGLWIETNRSRSDIIRVCSDILTICGFPPDAMIIETDEEN